MTMAIVHTGTGMTFAAHECWLVELSDDTIAGLSGDDYFDDVDIARFAVKHGHDMTTILTRDIPCASCELAGDETWINPFTARTVEWHVMGDPRQYVFVCGACAANTL